jgi:hypothetical protein
MTGFCEAWSARLWNNQPIPVEALWSVCDKCDKPTPTGIGMEPTDASNMFRNNTTRSQHCGNMILWNKAEPWPESVVRERFPELS